MRRVNANSGGSSSAAIGSLHEFPADLNQLPSGYLATATSQAFLISAYPALADLLAAENDRVATTGWASIATPTGGSNDVILGGTYGNGQAVYHGYDSTVASDEQGVLWYVDATDPSGTWTRIGNGSYPRVNQLAYGNGYWVMVDKDGAIWTATSLAGPWTENTGAGASIQNPYDLKYLGGYWVICAGWDTTTSNRPYIYYTTDPTGAWTKQIVKATNSQSAREIAYGNGWWVIRGTDHYIWSTQTMGGTWTEVRALASTSDWAFLVFDGTQFVGGWTSQTYKATDPSVAGGDGWVTAAGSTASLYGPAAADEATGAIYARHTASNDSMYYSTDNGDTWTSTSLGTSISDTVGSPIIAGHFALFYYSSLKQMSYASLTTYDVATQRLLPAVTHADSGDVQYAVLAE